MFLFVVCFCCVFLCSLRMFEGFQVNQSGEIFSSLKHSRMDNICFAQPVVRTFYSCTLELKNSINDCYQCDINEIVTPVQRDVSHPGAHFVLNMKLVKSLKCHIQCYRVFLFVLKSFSFKRAPPLSLAAVYITLLSHQWGMPLFK